MKLLLDTHALIWWIYDPVRLPTVVHDMIASDDNIILVSAVSAVEVTTKFRSGKLPGAGELAGNFLRVIADQGFGELPVTVEHGHLAGTMAIPHKDPFDRLLIAQAQVERAWLVSNEVLFDQIGVCRLW